MGLVEDELLLAADTEPVYELETVLDEDEVLRPLFLLVGEVLP